MSGESVDAHQASPADRSTPGWRLIGRSLRGNLPALTRLAGWSILEAVPAIASGMIVAHALDNGFLAGAPATGVAWFAALLVAHAVGALATRFTFPLVGTVVESLRDDLMRSVVHGAVRGGHPPGHAALRSAAQCESA